MNRQIIMGPIVIAAAFTLHSAPLMILQIMAGSLLTAVGIARLRK